MSVMHLPYLGNVTNASVMIILSVLIGCNSLKTDTHDNQSRSVMVIGNTHYEGAGYIPNAINDARDVADAFRELNYEVFEGIDLSKSEMVDLSRRWLAYSIHEDLEAAIFYYAGHAIQISEANYLLPIDIRPTTVDDMFEYGLKSIRCWKI